MIVRCPDCRSKYEISADRIPVGVFKLRCPRCKAVFPVTAQSEGDGAGVDAGAAPVHAHAPVPSVTEPAREVRLPEPGGVAAPPEVRPAAPPARPRISDPALARRMARAMISEMVLNRRSERDDAILSETVLSRFGPAIAGAFEVYREKVSPDLPAAPTFFRDAVNEILGGGSVVL